MVTLIFMAQFVFTVQQALLGYAAVDLPAQAATREQALFAAAVRSVGESVVSAADCADAQERFAEVQGFYERERPIGLFTVTVSGAWDCSKWANTAGAAPLTATVRVAGPGRESAATMGFYRD